MLASIIKKIRIDEMFKNTILSLTSKGISMILYMLTDIIIVRLLSISEYGEWSFFFSLISMFYWITWFGINTSTRVFVAKHTSNKKIRNTFIRAALAVRLITSTIISLIFLLNSSLLANCFGYPDKYPNLNRLLLIGCILMFFNSMLEFFKELNIGLINFINICYLSLIEYGGYLVFGVAGVVLWKNNFGLEIGYIFTSCLTASVGFIFMVKYFRKSYEYDKNIIKICMKEVFTYALPIMVSSIGTMILTEMDTFMLGLLTNSEQIAIYSVAKKLCSKATHVNLAISASTMTAFVILNKANIKSKVNEFKKIMLINAFISIGIALVFIVFGDIIINILYSSKYKHSVYILYILTPYYVLSSFAKFFETFLDYQKKAKIRGIFCIITVVVNLILNYYLIPLFGAKGAAIATVISMLPYSVFLVISTITVFRQYRNI